MPHRLWRSGSKGFAMVKVIGHCGYFWSRIYRRDFLKEFDLKFPEKVFFEDAYFNFMTAIYAHSAVKGNCPHFARCTQYKNTLFQLRFYLRLTMLAPRLAIWAEKMDWAVDLLGIIAGKLKRRK